MITIPDAVLDSIVQHRPHLATLADTLRAHPAQAAPVERALAVAYLAGASALSAADTYALAQVAAGGPWGGDWLTTARAAAVTGYSASHLCRLAAQMDVGRARKRGKTWYLRRDALPARRGRAEEATDAG